MENLNIIDWAHAKDLILMGLSGFAIHYIKQLTASVQELNIQVAVILEKLNGHEDRIKKLEDV